MRAAFRAYSVPLSSENNGVHIRSVLPSTHGAAVADGCGESSRGEYLGGKRDVSPREPCKRLLAGPRNIEILGGTVLAPTPLPPASGRDASAAAAVVRMDGAPGTLPQTHGALARRRRVDARGGAIDVARTKRGPQPPQQSQRLAPPSAAAVTPAAKATMLAGQTASACLSLVEGARDP